MRGIQHDEARQLTCGGGCNDLALEPALGEQRNSSAMIEMGVGEQKIIDGRGIKAESGGIFIVQLPAALKQTAIDENPAAAGLDQVTGSGNIVVRAVKGEFHLSVSFSGGPRNGRPAAAYQSTMPRQISSALSANQNSSRSSGSIVPSSTRKSGSNTFRQ